MNDIDAEIQKLLNGLHLLLNADETGALETTIIYVALLSFANNEKLINELRAIRKALEREVPQ